jgi:hypothetical protein
VLGNAVPKLVFRISPSRRQKKNFGFFGPGRPSEAFLGLIKLENDPKNGRFRPNSGRPPFCSGPLVPGFFDAGQNFFARMNAAGGSCSRPKIREKSGKILKNSGEKKNFGRKIGFLGLFGPFPGHVKLSEGRGPSQKKKKKKKNFFGPGTAGTCWGTRCQNLFFESALPDAKKKISVFSARVGLPKPFWA